MRFTWLTMLLMLSISLSLHAQAPVAVPQYPDHVDLSYYLTPTGKRAPLQSPADMGERRHHIREAMQSVMGKLPGEEKRVPLDIQELETIALANNLVRKKITFQSEPGDRVAAYLFVPGEEKESKQKLPAVLCLHQTTNIGKSEPAGLGGNPNLHYALHLAQRGYVTFAPDYPSFGDHAFDFNDPKFGYTSGSMKAIWDNMRAIDLLQSLPLVDPERIGCIGHSLGGHNTLFTTVFEHRIKAAVSNCGFTRFHKYYGGKLAGWTSARYMPRIAQVHENNPDKVPFDFPEIIAAIAPRPFLASSPIGDSNFEVSGVRDTIAAVKPIYQMFGKPDNLQANYPDCAHDFPEDVRRVAYEFLDRHLKAK